MSRRATDWAVRRCGRVSARSVAPDYLASNSESGRFSIQRFLNPDSPRLEPGRSVTRLLRRAGSCLSGDLFVYPTPRDYLERRAWALSQSTRSRESPAATVRG
jgi:hypothetical protein